MPTSLSDIKVKNSTSTLVIKPDDITINGVSIVGQNSFADRDLSNLSTTGQAVLNAKANDSAVVKLTGDQSVAGTKTFTSPVRRTASLGTSGSLLIQLVDTNNKGFVNLSSYYAGESIYNRLTAFNATSGKSGYIEIINTDDGTFRGAINGDGTSLSLTEVQSSTTDATIPTKGWVNNPATSTNVVHRTGNEMIAGTKTFTDQLIIQRNLADTRLACKNTGIQQGIAPSSNQYSGCRFIDKNNVELGSTYSAYRMDGSTRTGLFVKSSVAGATGSAEIGISCDINGIFYTYAPTPATTDNSTQIATTAYMNNKLQVVSALPASPDSNVFYFIPA